MSKELNESNRHLFSDFVIRSFRNQADRDYISARILFRAKLYHSVPWPALQAIEKYLKAILLFSFQPVIKYKHDAFRALKDVQGLPRLSFNVPEDVHDFVRHLTVSGKDRYLIREFSLDGDELLLLDLSVWHIRRYCQDFMLMPGDEAYDRAVCDYALAAAQQADPEIPMKFGLRGLLEKVLADGPESQRCALVWRNNFYSRRLRRINKEKLYRDRESSFAMRFEKPTHVMYPSLEDILCDMVQMS